MWYLALPIQLRAGHVGDLTAPLPVRAVYFGSVGQPRLCRGKMAAREASAQRAVMICARSRLMHTDTTDPSRNTDQGV